MVVAVCTRGPCGDPWRRRSATHVSPARARHAERATDTGPLSRKLERVL